MVEQKPATTPGPANPLPRAARRRTDQLVPGTRPMLQLVPGSLRARPDLLRSTALQAVFLAGLAVPGGQAVAQTAPAQAGPAPTALPIGGQVIAGQAKIATTTSAGTAGMTVTQATKYGAYDWKSFDIGKSASVTYQVPNSQSVSVNRVISPTSPSIIAGKLSSNGVLVVQNQSGVVFTQGAEVNVSTLIASAPGISDANARAGRLVFDQPAHPGARVENHGTITVAQTGLAALVAPQVANSGVIRAQMGRVVLAGAEAHTVDLYGDGLLSIDVTRQVTQAPVGPDGIAAIALVTNSGTIIADGGTILLTASAVDGLVQTLVTSGGTLRADTAGKVAGRIAVNAKGGNVAVTGTIAARGLASGTEGGQVEINAPSRSVTLKAGARVTVSGDTGGGVAAIGTTVARATGGNTITAPTARNVVIESGARVAADATSQGDGGNITLLSQGGTTVHRGALTARGGPGGGNGGFIEVSGDRFVLGGEVDVSAQAGAVGNILLDPVDLEITGSPTTGGGDAPVVKTDSITTKDGAGVTNLSVADILGLKGNITIEAKATLKLSAALDVTTSKNTIGDVTLLSGGTMTINAPLTGANAITLKNTGGNLAINAAVTTANGKTITLNSAGSIALGATVSAGTKGVIDLNAGAGGISQPDGSLVAGTLVSTTGIVGGAALNSGTNNLVTLGAIKATGGNLSLATSAKLSIEGAVVLDVGASASFAAPGLSFGGAGSVSVKDGTFALAPLNGAMSLGAASGDAVAVTAAVLAGVTAGTLQLGNAAGKTATAMVVNDDLDTSAFATTRLVAGAGGIALTKGALKAGILDVASGGGIADSALGVLAATVLQSTDGITGNVSLNTVAHAVAALGGISVTGGTIALTSSLALPVTGNVQAQAVMLASTATASATAIEVTGAGALSVTAGGAIKLGTAADSGVTLSGIVDASPTGTFNLAVGSLGATQAGGTITAGLLTGTAAANVTLPEITNKIGGVGTLVITDGDFILATSSAVGVTGALSAANVSIAGSAAAANAIAVAVSGSVTANGAAGVVTLAAANGGIALSGAVTASKGAIDLTAGAGGVLQTEGGIASPTLRSTGGIGGALSLTSATNLIASTGKIAVSGGDLLLSTNTTLNITEALSVGAGKTLSLAISGLNLSTGSLSAVGGTVEIAPLTAGAAMSLGKADTTELTLSTAALASIKSATLRLGGATASTTVADSLFVRDGFDATGSATAVLRLDAGPSGISIDTGVVLKANTLDLNSAGGVSGIAGSTVVASKLQSSTGITGNVELAEKSNAISTLGDITVTGGTLALTTSLALDIAGKVVADGATIESAAAADNAISVTGALLGTKGGTLKLNASDSAGGIRISGVVDATSAGKLDVIGGTSGIVQSGGTVTAGTLTGSTTGALTLSTADNQFTTIGDVAVTGDAKIASAVAMTIAGTLSAANATLSSGAGTASAIDVKGALTVKSTALLAATDAAGGITLSGTLEAATLDLSAGAGGVSQSGGSILASTVQSGTGIGGGVTLISDANQIATLGDIKVTTGDFTVVNATGTTLTIAKAIAVDTGRAIRIESDSTTITGTLSAPSGSVTLVAPSFGISLGVVSAGELAVLQTDVAAITADRIGLIASKGTITLRADLDTTANGATVVTLNANTGIALTQGTLSVPTLEIDAATGGFSQTAGLLVAKVLTAGAGIIGGAVTLDKGGNKIGSIGGVAATGAIAIASDVLMQVTGTMSAPGIALTGNAAVNSLSLETTGSLALTAPGTIALTTKGTTTLAGALNATSTGILSLDGAGGVKQTDGAIIAGTVTTPVSVGAANLGSDSNAIGALGAFTTSGDLRLATSVALGAANAVSAASITLRSTATAAKAIDIAPSANLATTANGSIVLDAGGGIALAGTVSAGTGSISLAAGAGGVAQTGGSLTAGTLLGIGTIAGPVELKQANGIGTLANLSATGAITLVSSQTLTVTGAVSAGDATTLSLSAPGMIFTGTGALTANGGTIEIGPSTGAATIGLGTAPGDFALGNLSNITAALVRIGQASSAGNANQAASIALAGTVTPVATTLELISSGAIKQTTGGLAIPVLTATATAIDIAQPGNTIAALGPMTTGGDLALASDSALSITGALSAANITLRSFAAAANALDVSGTLATAAGGTIVLDAANTAGGIALSGKLDATKTGTLDLSAGSNGITQSAGSLVAGTLLSSGGATGNVSLDQKSNAIGALGKFTVTGAGFTLRDGDGLDITGVIAASAITIRSEVGVLALGATGSLTTTGTALLAALGGGIGLDGTINAGVLDLSAGTGKITQNGGTISADTLRSTSGSNSAVALDKAGNKIGAVADFKVTGGDFSLVNAAGLTVNGLTADNVTLRTSVGTLDVATKGVTTAAGGVITLTAAGAMTLGGTVNATNTGTVDLSAGAGVSQLGASTITAATLRSTDGVTGNVALGSGNAVATIGDFAVKDGSFTFFDSTNLIVTGVLAAKNITLTGSAADPAALGVSGTLRTDAGGTIALAATAPGGGIALSGTVDATPTGLVDLLAGTGGIKQSAGAIIASTVQSNNGVAGSVSLDQAGNAFDALGTFTVTAGNLSLTDSRTLTVIGPLTVKAGDLTLTSTAGGAGALAVSGPVTVSGTTKLVASAVDGGVALAGTLKTATLDLSTGGDVGQGAGIVIAVTLSGTVGGSLTLAQPANNITTIGVLGVADTAKIASASPLDIVGLFSAAAIDITGISPTANAVSLSGTASATGTMTLASGASGGIALSGTAKAATLDLSAGTSGIKQTAGSLIAGTLLSSGGATGNVSLDQNSNAVGALGNFTVTGAGFTLRDSDGLDITGAIAANAITIRSEVGVLVLGATGSLATTGTALLAALGGGIGLDGTINAGVLDLSAGTGKITQNDGTINAATLRSTSDSNSSVALDKAGNTIGAVADFKITGGDFSLVNAAGLTVNGLTADNVTLQTSIGTLDVAAKGVTTAAGGVIALTAAGAMSLGGNVNATNTGTVNLSAGASVSQLGASTITAATLRSTGGVTGNVALGSGNAVATIGDFAVKDGSFTFFDSTKLIVTGVLSAKNITLTGSAADPAALGVSGAVRTAAGGTIALAATAPGGGIALSGTVDATPTGLFDLQAGSGGIVQSAGAITTSALQSNNGVGGTVTLDQPANAIDVLGNFTVKAGNLSLTGSRALTVAGPVTISAGDLTLTSSAAGPLALALTGPVSASSGIVRLVANAPDGGIVLASTLNAATLDLLAGTGGVTQTAGALGLGILRASGLNGSVSLAGATNSIGTIADFITATGDIALVNATKLTVAGTLQATTGNLALTSLAAATPAITITGTVASGTGRTLTVAAPNGGLTLAAGGQLAAPAGIITLATATGIAAPGTVTAGKLAVTATNPTANITLSGTNTNAIGTLASATLAGGIFSFNTTTGLTIAGNVTAPLVRITAAGTLKVADGVTITTDGKTRADQGVSATLPDAEINTFTGYTAASFLEVTTSGGAPGKIETGSIKVLPFSVAQATLDFVLPTQAGSTISIGQLAGKTTDLILVSRSGGIVTGTVDVAGLLLLGSGGKSDLFGSVGGLQGQAAANKANISPRPSADYRFNACPITSVNCVLIPLQTIPPMSPLRDVPNIRDRPTQDDTDVQLPNVSDEDY